MNSVTLLYSLLLSVACMSMAVEPIIIGCSNPPSLVAPTIEFRQGQNVCGPSDVLFWIRFIGSGGQYRLRSGFFPRAAGEMACSVDINTLQVSPNSDPSAGSAELSITSPNGTTNFSLYYTSGAILPITPSTVEVIEGTTNVKMTWLHSSARGNLTLIHYSPDGQVRTFLINSFGNINSDQFTVDLASACELLQDRLATRSVTINKVTMSLGGVYSVIYTNETTVSVIRNITVVVLPAPTPSVTPSLTTSNTISTSSDTPNGSSVIMTSQTPTILPGPAVAPYAAIIAVTIVLVVILVAILATLAITIIVCKHRRTGFFAPVSPRDNVIKPIPNQSPVSTRSNTVKRSNSNLSSGSQTIPLMQTRSGSVSTRSGSFSAPGTPSKLDYTGVFAINGYTHIKTKMLNKYKDQVHDLKDKEELISALLDPHCKEILAFAGSNGNTDWEGIFREIESRAFPIPDSPKITRVIFSDSDPADDHCVETGRTKFVYFVGKPDDPDILGKLMMKGDLPVLKKDYHQRYPSSDATLLTQDSRNEPDYPSPINEEERTLQASCSTHSESPAVTHVKSEINLSGSANSTPPVKQDRHTAATSMQLTTASYKKVEQLQTPETGLQSMSAPLISAALVEELAKQNELRKKEIKIFERIERNTQITAEKAGEQVGLLTDHLVAADPAPPPPPLP